MHAYEHMNVYHLKGLKSIEVVGFINSGISSWKR